MMGADIVISMSCYVDFRGYGVALQEAVSQESMASSVAFPGL